MPFRPVPGDFVWDPRLGVLLGMGGKNGRCLDVICFLGGMIC